MDDMEQQYVLDIGTFENTQAEAEALFVEEVRGVQAASVYDR